MRQAEVIAARKKELKRLRELQKEESGSAASAKRLEALKAQADVFCHFASSKGQRDSGNGTKGSKGGEAGKAKAEGRRSSGRLSEKEEDEMLLEQEGASQERLLVQPPCISGKMRAYQAPAAIPTH